MKLTFLKNNQTHFSSVAGVHHTLRLPSESHCLNNHIGQPAVEQKKRLKMFLSDPSQIITLPCHSVIPCSGLFLFKLLDLSKLSNLLHGFVKSDTWICLSCHMDFSNLLNGFVKLVTCFSRPWPNKIKLKFDHHFEAG